MDTATSKRIGKKAVKLGYCKVKHVNEAFRIQSVRADIGEPVGMTQVLFENGHLDADQVYELQDALKLRIVFCHSCGAERNVYDSKPGGTAKCTCKAKLRVPGNDPEDPFQCVTKLDKKVARETARPKQTGGAVAAGAFGLLPLAGLLGAAAVGAWSGPFRYPAIGAAATFALLAFLMARKKQTLAASGLGLAIFTGLVVAAAALHQPGEVGAFGVSAHQLLGPLVLTHVVLLFFCALPWLRKVQSPWLFLVLYVPLGYALLYFISRSIPGIDPSTLVSGPEALERVPWYLHPGQVTFLVIFPFAVLAMSVAGLVRLTRGGKRTLLRDSGLLASLALLSAFGLSLAAMHGQIPSPAVKAQVEQAFAGRQAGWMAGARATTAVAVTKTSAGEEIPTKSESDDS